MYYQCVSAKFYFYNGELAYTVEFVYGVSSWFVFRNTDTTGALFSKRIYPAKSKSPNRDLAEEILTEYLNNKT